jgi:integrase
VTERSVTRRARRRSLTDKMVAALPRRTAAFFHPDPELPKHGVRVRPHGPGTYTIITRDPYRKQRWVRIGSTAEMTIAQARDLARIVIRRIEQGLAPFEEPPPQPESVAAVAENWLKRHVEKNRLRTGAEMRRVVEKYILPHVGGRNFVDLKRRDIAELLDHVEDRHGAHTADAALAVLRALATWVQSRDETYTPPFTKGMRRVPKAARVRARILNDDELRAVWTAAGDAGAYGGMVRLALLTAQRRDKVASMRWDDVSPEGVWTIRTAPREKGNPGSLKLPEVALAIICTMPRFVSNAHVLAGQLGAINNFSRAKEALDAASGVENWTVHDLRRTARSLMSRAGVRPDIAERVLGHAVAGVEGVYDRHHYRDELADALRRLAALIERIVNPPSGNVVALHEAAAAS